MNKYMKINTDGEGWTLAMYRQKCICGHELYKHTLTQGKHDKTSWKFRISQCDDCGHDEKNEKFLCEGFIEVYEKNGKILNRGFIKGLEE